MNTTRNVKITATTAQIAAAFTEWERRYRMEPDRFQADFERALESTETYGEAAAAYLTELLIQSVPPLHKPEGLDDFYLAILPQMRPPSPSDKAAFAAAVIGPQGCGKTHNAWPLAKALGCTRILDEPLERCTHAPADNTLLLTTDPDRATNAGLVIHARSKEAFDRLIKHLPATA